MKKYKVTTEYATFGAGIILMLTKEQANPRFHSLTLKGKDKYEIKEPIQFKQGEEITLIKGTLSRFLQDRLQEVGKQEKPSKPDVGNTNPEDPT